MKEMYEIIGDTLYITVGPELDHHNAQKIGIDSDRYIYTNKAKNVVFDFQNTKFMDSSGIGVIMGRYKLVSGIGGKVRIRNISRTLDRIFLLSGLYKIVEKDESA